MAHQDIDIESIKNRYGIVGNAPELNLAIRTALSVAKTDLPVLIVGESGVGKDVFSRMIHDFSKRKSRKFLPVNCGAIPSGTVNSELFGHERGSFTGAVEARKGWFEEADGGTIFLDEIGELPKDTQAQLLRVLQQGEFMRVGSSKIQRTDVRIIAATNMDMAVAISRDRFRLDLYYRLNTITLKIPALRDRPDDIPLLFKQFCLDFSERNNYRSIALTRDAEAMLKHYRWPGNVRELISVANRVCTMESYPVSPASKEERIMLTSVKLANYMPVEDDQFIPAVVEGQAGSFAPGDREMLIRSILTLKQEVEQLKKSVAALEGGARISESALPALTPRAGSMSSHSAASFSDNGLEPEEQVQEDDLLPSDNPEVSAQVQQPQTLEDKGYQAIRDSMLRNGGNRSKVARELGISERTVYRKLDKMIELGIWQKN
ncbi:MAG: sigma-54 dependent transcriptional regulator [Bacteroidales bacterium]|nr:sigma-54 dependent transcriptional regulator [Bacteroidales bacterium]